MLESHPLETLPPLETLGDAFGLGTQSISLRYASESFITRDTDAPASTFIAGRINRGLEIGRELTKESGGQIGSLIEARFGEIELNNTDGALDLLVNDYYADGREIRLKIGAKETVVGTGETRVQPLSSFALVYRAVAGAWSHPRRDVLNLRVQTLAGRLQDKLQLLTFSGDGGEGGGPEMAGRSRPLTFGHCLNVSAQISAPETLSAQVHSRSIEGIDAVYDQGVAYTFTADYPSYAALSGATVQAGRYATSLADGYIRVGSLLGLLTADVKGDNVGGYVDTHAGIIRRMAVDFGPLTLVEVDVASFTAYAAAQPAECGIFFAPGDQTLVEEAMSSVAFSGGAFAGQDRSGLYRVQQLSNPAMVQHWTFDDRDIIDIERVELPYGVPWKSWGVGYRKNWTVQRGGDLALGVDDDRKQFLQSDYRYAYAADANIALAHQTSAGAPLRPSLFLERTDAEAEAERLISFYALGRAMYLVRVKNVLFSAEIGQTVRLIFPRWNLAAGRNFVVIGVADDAATRISELQVFG